MTPEALKVLDKVKKLFALASNEGATEGERDNAMRMAQALLRKHNLSEKQLGFAGMEKAEVAAKDLPYWCKIVYNSVTRLFGCYYYNDGDTPVIVGPAASTTTADYVARFMVESIEKQARQLKGLSKLDSLFAGIQTPTVTKQYEEQFKLAASNALAEKIRTMLGPEEKESRALSRKFMEAQGVTFAPSRSKALQATHASEAGKSFGSSLNPSAQVGPNRAPLRLGKS